MKKDRFAVRMELVEKLPITELGTCGIFLNFFNNEKLHFLHFLLI